MVTVGISGRLRRRISESQSITRFGGQMEVISSKENINHSVLEEELPAVSHADLLNLPDEIFSFTFYFLHYINTCLVSKKLVMVKGKVP